MGDRKRSDDDAATYDKRRDQIREESATARHDGAEYPSAEDVAGERGERTSADPAPRKDGVASDSEAPADELHGSLHGRWNKSDEPAT
jgi:hypothetical protein